MTDQYLMKKDGVLQHGTHLLSCIFFDSLTHLNTIASRSNAYEAGGIEAANEAERLEIQAIRKEKDEADERNFMLFEQMMREGKAIRRQREEEERVQNGLPSLSSTDGSTSNEGAKENVRVNDVVAASEPSAIDTKWKRVEIEEVDDEVLPPTPTLSNATSGHAVLPPAPPSSNNLDELD